MGMRRWEEASDGTRVSENSESRGFPLIANDPYALGSFFMSYRCGRLHIFDAKRCCMREPAQSTVYLFIDEAGNFDFTPSGTRYFILTCISRHRPLGGGHDLHSLKYELMEKGLAEIECFHASEDSHPVRAAVWEIVIRHLGEMVIDSLIVEKARVVPGLRKPEKLYPWAMSRLMRHVLGKMLREETCQVMVLTDRLPLNKHRALAEKSIRTELARVVAPDSSFRLMHHASISNPELQLADYINWAIFRKWERADCTSYELIARSIRSEHDVFYRGGLSK